MSRRGDVLELAVLGLLQEAPMHGYELRKQLNAQLGTIRALSYGTLYPALKSLVSAGLIREARHRATEIAPPLAGKRARIVYELTAEGKERFQLADAPRPAPQPGRTRTSTSTSPSSPAPTPPPGWRSSKAAGSACRNGSTASGSRWRARRERLDRYTLELQRHGLESVEREVRWLTELIDSERAGNMTHLRDPGRRGAPAGTADPLSHPGMRRTTSRKPRSRRR